MEFIPSILSGKYTSVASVTVLLYDMGLTMDEEVERVWGSKLTLGTTLFYLATSSLLRSQTICGCRLPHIPRRLDHDRLSCKKYILAYLSFDLIETVFTQCTLILCTHALYRKTPLLIFLLSLCVATIALDIASLAKFIPGCEIATFLNDWNMRGCVMLCWSYTFMIFITLTWIPLFLLEILTTILTIWKSYKSLSPYSLPWAKRLLWALMRDRFIYFCAIIAITVLYFLATWGYSAGITPSISHYLVIALQKGVQPALCSRLLLGLRRPLNYETATEHDSPSSPIAFASQTTKQEEALHPR